MYSYLNGNIYSGGWINDKKHGQGTYIYAISNEKYEGEWSQGNRHGSGVFTYQIGIYDGQFVNNTREGYGRFRYCNNSLLEGNWKGDKVEGLATLTLINGE